MSIFVDKGPLVEAEGVQLGFPARGGQAARALVAQLNFVLCAGQRMGLTGRSGQGKSTFLSAILCQSLGRPVAALQAGRLTVTTGPIGYVSQRNDTPPWYSVGRLLDGFRTRAPAVRQDALGRITNHFGLDCLRHSYPNSLSGGELQRLKVVLALSMAGDLVVLDEPLTALDVATKMELLACVSEYLDAHNIASLIVSHDMDILFRQSEVVHVLSSDGIILSIPGRLAPECQISEYDMINQEHRSALFRALVGIDLPNARRSCNAGVIS